MIGAKFVKRRLIVLLVLTALVSGCTAGRAFRKGRESARTGDWDTAVMHYTEALQASPDNAEYKIELERATQNAARDHITRAREYEQKDQLDAALIEYKKAVEMDASNRLAATKTAELERVIRDRIEQSRPRPPIERLRQQARAQGAAGAQPGRSHAAQDQLQQLEPARHPQLHRHDDRHQHSARQHVRRQGVHRESRWHHARGGAAANPLGERFLLQGAEPDDHRHRAGHACRAPEVRRSGHAGLLPLACRRAGGIADAERDDAHPGAGGAGDLSEQDVEHDCRACHGGDRRASPNA